jgi:tRNA U34 2-thiouridine synthase MnmA/TrmU
MEKRFINLKQVQILIKINLIFYVNYQEQLAKSLFPIGALTKPEVREIATEMELITAEKIARFVFYWKRVLQQNCKPKEGLIIQIDKMIRFTILKPTDLSIEELKVAAAYFILRMKGTKNADSIPQTLLVTVWLTG